MTTTQHCHVFDSLPDELLSFILQHVNPDDVVSVSQSSVSLRQRLARLDSILPTHSRPTAILTRKYRREHGCIQMLLSFTGRLSEDELLGNIPRGLLIRQNDLDSAHSSRWEPLPESVARLTCLLRRYHVESVVVSLPVSEVCRGVECLSQTGHAFSTLILNVPRGGWAALAGRPWLDELCVPRLAVQTCEPVPDWLPSLHSIRQAHLLSLTLMKWPHWESPDSHEHELAVSALRLVRSPLLHLSHVLSTHAARDILNEWFRGERAVEALRLQVWEQDDLSGDFVSGLEWVKYEEKLDTEQARQIGFCAYYHVYRVENRRGEKCGLVIRNDFPVTRVALTRFDARVDWRHTEWCVFRRQIFTCSTSSEDDSWNMLPFTRRTRSRGLSREASCSSSNSSLNHN